MKSLNHSRLLLLVLPALLCPAINCGVFGKFVGVAKNGFRSSFGKPAMLRCFDPKSIVLDDKYKDNPGVRVSLAIPKIEPYWSANNRTMPLYERQKYENALIFAVHVIIEDCRGPVEAECDKAIKYSKALSQAQALDPVADTKKMAEEGVTEINAQRWTVVGMDALWRARHVVLEKE